MDPNRTLENVEQMMHQIHAALAQLTDGESRGIASMQSRATLCVIASG